MTAVKVVIADKDVLIREGMACLLHRAGLRVVGKAADAAALLELVGERHPDLVLVDIRMPPGHQTEGLDAAKTIRERFPETAIVILSTHIDVRHALDLLRHGHKVGYLLKDRIEDVADLIDAVERVARGGSFVDPVVVAELVSVSRASDPLAALSARELEVLSLMAQGRSNAGIARTLWLAEGTVEKHVRSILLKLRIAESDADHRRVLAVLSYLEARHAEESSAWENADG